MKFIRFLKTDVKIINSYFLIILILLILVCVVILVMLYLVLVKQVTI